MECQDCGARLLDPPAPPALPAPPPPPEPLDVELIVGCVVGGVVFVALLAGRAAD